MDPDHLSLDLMCPEMFTGGFVYLIYGESLFPSPWMTTLYSR